MPNGLVLANLFTISTFEVPQLRLKYMSRRFLRLCTDDQRLIGGPRCAPDWSPFILTLEPDEVEMR